MESAQNRYRSLSEQRYAPIERISQEALRRYSSLTSGVDAASVMPANAMAYAKAAQQQEQISRMAPRGIAVFDVGASRNLARTQDVERRRSGRDFGVSFAGDVEREKRQSLEDYLGSVGTLSREEQLRNVTLPQNLASSYSSLVGTMMQPFNAQAAIAAQKSQGTQNMFNTILGGFGAATGLLRDMGILGKKT